jgi:hypothetical protein
VPDWGSQVSLYDDGRRKIAILGKGHGRKLRE